MMKSYFFLMFSISILSKNQINCEHLNRECFREIKREHLFASKEKEKQIQLCKIPTLLCHETKYCFQTFPTKLFFCHFTQAHEAAGIMKLVVSDKIACECRNHLTAVHLIKNQIELMENLITNHKKEN